MRLTVADSMVLGAKLTQWTKQLPFQYVVFGGAGVVGLTITLEKVDDHYRPQILGQCHGYLRKTCKFLVLLTSVQSFSVSLFGCGRLFYWLINHWKWSVSSGILQLHWYLPFWCCFSVSVCWRPDHEGAMTWLFVLVATWLLVAEHGVRAGAEQADVPRSIGLFW